MSAALSSSTRSLSRAAEVLSSHRHVRALERWRARVRGRSVASWVGGTGWAPAAAESSTAPLMAAGCLLAGVSADRLLPALVSSWRPLWDAAVRPSLPESSEAGFRLAKKLHLMLFFFDAK